MSTSLPESEFIQERIRRLKNRQKILLNRKAYAQRKMRTHRLIEHGAILESVFPEIVSMAGEQVKTFLQEKRDSRKSNG